jgi:hypothetical protein
MNARRTARPLAALATIAVVIAACGNGAATTAPATGVPATVAPVTEAPATQAAVGSGVIPSFALPSFHSDTQLEDLFPDQIGGEDVTVLSMSGDQFMGSGSSPELDAALQTLGKSASDLSVAFGSAGNVTIIAFKVSGIPASTIQTALFQAYQQETESTISDATFSGKSVKKITPNDTTEDVSYIYGVQDVVFAVGGTDVTDAQLTEVFSKLP